MARYTNSRIIPNLHTTTVQTVFDSEQKKPGWDKHEIDWYWFIEVRLGNESDTPITVEDVRGIVRVGGNKWLRWIPGVRKTFVSSGNSDPPHSGNSEPSSNSRKR